MTINKNTTVNSTSQLKIYVKNVRSLGTQITSTKFTRPLDQGWDVYIFVDHPCIPHPTSLSGMHGTFSKNMPRG